MKNNCPDIITETAAGKTYPDPEFLMEWDAAANDADALDTQDLEALGALSNVLPFPQKSASAELRFFFDLVLPDDGAYQYARLAPKRGGQGKDPMSEYGAEAIADLVSTVRKADLANPDGNLYFCTASLGDKTKEIGSTRVVPARWGANSKEGSNVKAKRCLHVDIDVGKKTGTPSYATPEEARQAIEDMIPALGLGRPLVVESGMGFHLYWPLSENVSEAVWLPVAMQLKQALGHLGVKIDPSVITNSVTLLRPVGTHWRKEGKERVVRVSCWGDGPESLDWYSRRLARIAGAAPATETWEKIDTAPAPDLNQSLTNQAPFSISRNKTALRSALYALDVDSEPDWWSAVKAVKGALALPEATDEERVWIWDAFMEWTRRSTKFESEAQQRAKMETSNAEHPRTLFNRAKAKGWQNPGEDRANSEGAGSAGGEAGVTNQSGYVVLQSLNDVEMEKITWLWDGYLARGKFHLLAGHAGVSKTTLALSLAARITTGAAWPDGTKSEIGNVLIWTGEDGVADTIKPRLMVNGADPNRVFVVAGARDDAGKPRPFDPATDMPQLRQAAKSISGGVALMIVDPVVSAVKGDSHKNAEVRRDLQELVDLGAELGCAVLGITHLTKGTKGSRIGERVTGSLAFNALARVVMGCAQMPEDAQEDGMVAFFRTKSNIGPDRGGFYYDIGQVEIPNSAGILATQVTWRASIEDHADEIMARSEATGEKSATRKQEAAEYLLGLLKDGPVKAKDAKAEAKEFGFSDGTIMRAKLDAKIQDSRWGFGAKSIVWWYAIGTLPPDWDQRRSDWVSKHSG